MSIEAHSIDELRAEIVRRQEAERTELRRQLADLEAQAAAIRAKLGIAPKREARAPRGLQASTAPVRGAVIAFLYGREAPSSPSEVAKALGVTPSAAGAVLRALLANGEVIRTGHAKGSRYAMVGKGAIVTD